MDQRLHTESVLKLSVPIKTHHMTTENTSMKYLRIETN